MQNGIDCGAINVSVLLALISTGSVYDRRDYLVKLRMACAHDVWLQVLEVVVNHLPVIYKTYLLHQISLGHHELVTDAIVNIFSQGIESYYNTYAIQRSLEDDRHGCGVCSRTVEREHEKDGIYDSDYSGTSKKEMEEGWADDITFTWLHKLRKMFHALKNARQICKVVKSAQLAKGLTTVPLELLPVFSHMFASSKLQKVKEHLLPVRKKMVTEEVDEDSECVREVKVMGIKEMLDAAEEYPEAGIDVFIKGQLRDGTYIKFDPT